MTETLTPVPCPTGCGHAADTFYLRHLDALEYGALSDGLRPIDAYAVTPVRCCGDCLPGPICVHAAAEPAPCPDCHAEPGQPCIKPDGAARPVEHPARAAAQPQPDPCRHAHREDCTNPATCQCTGDDQPPVRIPGRPQDIPQPDLTRLPEAAALLAQHQINPKLRRSEVRTGYTQDNRHALIFDYAQDDGTGQPARDIHGHEIITQRVIPVQG